MAPSPIGSGPVTGRARWEYQQPPRGKEHRPANHRLRDMRPIHRLITLGATLALLGVPAIALAAAPPQYVTSSPGNDAEVSSPPSSVSITFDQPLDPSSAITGIEDHCGHEVSEGSTQVTGNQMQISMDSEAEGMYHVSYFVKGVGGVTGQQQGTFTFTVTEGPSCGKPAHDHMHMHMGHHHGHHNMNHHHMHMGHNRHMHMGHHSMHMSHGTHMGGHDMSHMSMGGSDHSTHSDDMDGMDMGHHHTTHEVPPLGITSTGANGDPGLDRAGMAALLTAVLLALGLGTVGGTVLRVSEPS